VPLKRKPAAKGSDNGNLFEWDISDSEAQHHQKKRPQTQPLQLHVKRVCNEVFFITLLLWGQPIYSVLLGTAKQ
jgi:hypothetical protein